MIDPKDIVYVNNLLNNTQYFINKYEYTKDTSAIKRLIDLKIHRLTPPSTVKIQPTKVDIDITIRSEPVTPKVSITVEEFINIASTNEFIQQYLRSIQWVLQTKRNFYNSRIKSIHDEYGCIVDRIRQLNIVDTSIKINDIVDVTSLLTEYVYIKDIIQRLDNIVVNEATLRRNLNSIIEDPEYGINSIVGRDDIKRVLVGMIYSFANKPQVFFDTFNNIAIYGPSGVGKTRLGQVISFILSKSYILVKENFLVKTRSDLVSQWLGGTAIKTRSLLYTALESVLFIDEAYQLTVVGRDGGSGRDYGQESIGEILTFLDRYRGKCVLIVSGYQREMEEFMRSNEGLPRRFLYTMVLNPYSIDELTMILVKTLSKYYSFDSDMVNYIYSIIDMLHKYSPATFDKQAGDILNLSTFILRKISSSYQYRWDHSKKDRIVILVEAFNEYLQHYKRLPISLTSTL
jgi:hypothetical protein